MGDPYTRGAGSLRGFDARQLARERFAGMRSASCENQHANYRFNADTENSLLILASSQQ